MITRGMQNADAIIAASKKTLADLGKKAKPEWKKTLNDAVTTLEDMKTKFFLKTNFAIPPTNACLKDATELASLAASGNLAKFPEVMMRFDADVKKLIDQSKLDGAILT